MHNQKICKKKGGGKMHYSEDLIRRLVGKFPNDVYVIMKCVEEGNASPVIKLISDKLNNPSIKDEDVESLQGLLREIRKLL